MAGYIGGRIKRIKIQNFMTYDDLEIFPKNGLNLIVGLNGSGKSSIMCAICLGLAGKPQFTGRATQLCDFIKHGHKEAEIEIELESVKGKNVVICRKLKGEKTEWFLNKLPSNLNEVSSSVKKFNIDTSNLCQFLPQEKVVEFSRMDKKQRLDNMLQAIGEPHLFQLFNELKDFHKRGAELESSIRKLESKKSCDEEKNDRINDEVQKQENRVRLKRELEILLNKQKLLKYNDLHLEIRELKNEKKKLEKEHEKWNNKFREGAAAQNAIEAECQKYMETLTTLNSQKTSLCKKINISTSNSNVVTRLNEEIENAKIEFRNKLAEKENQKKRLQDVNRQIEGLERLLADEPNKARDLKEKLAVNKQEFTRLNQEVSDLYETLEVANAERFRSDSILRGLKSKKNAMEDEQLKKLTNLRKIDYPTYEGVCWLQNNRSRFKSNIYLPVMLEIKVLNSENCKYIENQIAFRDMIAFVCEDSDDCKMLTTILKNQMKLPVNVVMAPSNPLSSYKSPGLTDQLKNCGLECFLMDLFTAPEPVMRYLCCCYNIHKIPVAKSTIGSNKMEHILKKFNCFYAGNMKVTGVRSRYGDRHMSDTRQFISNRNLLTCQKDDHMDEIQAQYQQVEKQLNSENEKVLLLQSQLSEKEKLLEECRQQKKELQENYKRLQNVHESLRQKKSYREKMSIVIDEEEEKRKIKEKVRALNAEKIKAFCEQNEIFKKLVRLQTEGIKLILYMNCLSKKYKIMKAENEDLFEKVKKFEDKINGLRTVIAEKKLPAEKLMQEIKEMRAKNGKRIRIIVDDDCLITNVEGTLEETEQKINHIQAQLNLNEDNEPLIAEFNARKKKIEEIQEQIFRLQINLDELKTSLDEKKQEWLDPLQQHIQNINRKFSQYFKHLKCAGEISLDIPNNEDDFSNYGLQIKLKFHDDEPLTELSQTHHSGGECSVAAIVFILSLQELTEVPFRCIDEINQGMDSVYERKIYQLVADSVGNDTCSQYFLLTPKLLMDLQYPDDIAVHVIYNSCFLNCKIDVKQVLKVAKSA